MSDTPESPETIYRRRSADFGVLHVATQRRSRRTGDVGLGILLIAVVLWAVAFLRNEALWFVAAGLFTIAFIVTVVRRNRLNLAAARYGLLATINAEGIARLQRDWSGLPKPTPSEPTDIPAGPR
ncbi:MAG: hypothetical protein IPK16_02875 [Anaerolineales bacterium]|nr:hypothetical protein [Anaerolineales bacterium]